MAYLRKDSVKSDELIFPQLTAHLKKGAWNAISANIGWLACVFGAARGQHWLGLLVVGILFIVHITAIEKHQIRQIFSVALTAIIIGFLTDTALILLGTVDPNRWLIPSTLMPLWDLAIWANFSLTLNKSLHFLQKRLLVGAVLGALCAPGTYYAAGRLGALYFSEPILNNLLWVGVFWFFAMPCLSLVSRYFYHSSKRKFFD